MPRFENVSHRYFHVLFFSVLLIYADPVQGQASSPFEEGLTLHKKSVSSGPTAQGHRETGSTMFISSSSIREKSSDGEEFIVFYEEKRLVTIDHNKKTYSETTFQELEDRLERVSRELSEEAEEHQETMQITRQMLGNRIGEIRLEKQGPGEEIAGFATEKYLLSMPPVEMLIWAAPSLVVPDSYFDMLKLHAVPNPLFDMTKMFDAFKQVEGLGLRTEVRIVVMGMTSEMTDEVVEIERGPVPEPEIPEDYQRIDLRF